MPSLAEEIQRLIDARLRNAIAVAREQIEAASSERIARLEAIADAFLAYHRGEERDTSKVVEACRAAGYPV